MMYLLAATLLIGFATADTNVSVIECGHSGTVRSAIGGRNGLGSTVGDVGSFWSNLHNFQQSRRDGRKNRREHRAGFSLVADHFNKPAGGLAVSLVGEAVDMNMFPKLSAYLKSSESVVGSFNMAGSQSGLLETIVGGETNILKVNEAVGVIRSKVDEFRKRGDNMIESVEINVDNTESAAEIDGKLSALLGSLSEEDGKTVVLHLIVDETAKSRRRLAERRLEDEQDEDEEEDKDEEEEDNEENEGEVEDEQNKHKPSIFQNNSDLEKKKKKSSIIAKPQQQQPLACLQNEGTIRVGNQHQASVPPLQTVPTIGMTHGTTSNAFPTECTSSAQHQHRNNKFAFLAKPCWAPGRISHTIVIKYLYDTGKFLNEYLKQCKEQDVTYASLSDQDDELWYRPQRQQNPPTITRECDRDRLLDELHNCDYSVTSAMQKVHLNPTYYLTLWSYAEKNQFDAGSRRYCGSLRMVTKGVPTKVEKEIVDYHYRFKITDQFRRYEEQKREQAQRMMVEADARLRENFSVRKGGEADSGLILGGSIAGATGGNGFSSGSGGGNTQKKLRNITSLGATEQRRHVAQDYLIHVRDVIGSKHYLRLVAVLKRYHEGDLDVPLLIEHITNLLQNSPNNPKEAEALVPKFLTFVPQIFRSDK
mmetsp:Transcript_9878/g.11355  ORF Transcript_9878/g.11355 Transcript_9878/m.11355 type:complete len:648 (+) Transcript_9878:115-2058(+)